MVRSETWACRDSGGRGLPRWSTDAAVAEPRAHGELSFDDAPTVEDDRPCDSLTCGRCRREGGLVNMRDAGLRAAALAARCARLALPLAVRKRLVSEVARRNVPGQVTIGIELLRDLARHDPVGFHHYLWANHLAYAKTYRLGRFAPEALQADHKALFELLCAELRRQGLDPREDIHSILDAGASLGYLLRHAETSVFPSATTLTGIDIDVRAVAAGSLHLRRIGSRVELMVAGMEQLDEVLPGRRFDVVVACGSLTYLDQAHAARAVASLLGHADRVVGLIDGAHPVTDNASLARSAVRNFDQAWFHNLDSMVQAASGHVTFRQWQPPTGTDDRGVYMLIAAAANPTPRARGSSGLAGSGRTGR
jgi:SAM-dependent methyltransferase